MICHARGNNELMQKGFSVIQLKTLSVYRYVDHEAAGEPTVHVPSRIVSSFSGTSNSICMNKTRMTDEPDDFCSLCGYSIDIVCRHIHTIL